MNHAPRDKQRGDHRAEIRAAVEYGRGQRALAFGKPFGNSFDGRGKVAGLADRKRAADHHMHHHQPPDKGIENTKDGPGDERKRQSELGADFVNEPAHQHRHAGVDSGEKGSQIGEVGVAPAETALFRRRAEKLLEEADNLPVQVIDGGGEEEQSADDPSVVARGRRGFGIH